MVDVFEQVEEELRSERYKRLARTWLPVLGGLLAVALVAALAWWGWQSYVSSQADKASAAYQQGIDALQEGKTAEARTAFAESAKAGGGYKALALMQEAGLAQAENKTADAVALLDEAAKATRDPILSDIAALKAVFLVMDTASLEDVQKRLEPLTGEKRPMSAFAQEALAMAQLQHGKTAEARQTFVQLQLGQDVPDPVRQRAQAAVQAVDTGTAANLAAIVKAAAALPTPTPGQAAAAAPAEAAAPAQAPAATPAP
ncbi:MAG: tetratricopeptide repeat protein [Brevundimonas sp.]|uniref:Tetratricopeptide repeat protein n=2 Tax=Brevundimonas TaxID=41275 RepID=A0ABZ2IGM6_9CAUL|nr:tetratricopeptide repeat protein [Brevundimonas sp.]MCH4266805.1 tetratricopeptide repeat protein [Brevundimonas sp.]